MLKRFYFYILPYFWQNYERFLITILNRDEKSTGAELLSTE